jgi:hypothetical protein
MADRHLYLDPCSVLEATDLEEAPLGSVVVQAAAVEAGVDQDVLEMAASTRWVVSVAAAVVSRGSRYGLVQSELIRLSTYSTIQPLMLAGVPVDRYTLASGVLAARFDYFIFRRPRQSCMFHDPCTVGSILAILDMFGSNSVRLVNEDE